MTFHSQTAQAFADKGIEVPAATAQHMHFTEGQLLATLRQAREQIDILITQIAVDGPLSVAMKMQRQAGASGPAQAQIAEAMSHAAMLSGLAIGTEVSHFAHREVTA